MTLEDYDIRDPKTENILINFNVADIACSLEQLEEKINALAAVIANTGVSAKDAGNAFRNLALRVYDPIAEEFKYIAPQEATGPQTLGSAEKSNQIEPFDFLEQNAYERIEPLDIDEKF